MGRRIGVNRRGVRVLPAILLILGLLAASWWVYDARAARALRTELDKRSIDSGKTTNVDAVARAVLGAALAETPEDILWNARDVRRKARVEQLFTPPSVPLTSSRDVTALLPKFDKALSRVEEASSANAGCASGARVVSVGLNSRAVSLSHGLGLRVLAASAQHDAAGLVKALEQSAFWITCLRPDDALGDAQRTVLTIEFAHDLNMVLQRVRVPRELLARVDLILSRFENENRVSEALGHKWFLLAEQFRNPAIVSKLFIERTSLAPIGPVERIVRPWLIAAMVRELRVAADLAVASEAPLPTRLHNISEMARSGSEHRTVLLARRSQAEEAEQIAEIDAATSALLRSLRAALRVEAYRRTHEEQVPPEAPLADLSDPFNGKPLLYEAEGAGYVVYSVGPDFRDDGGDLGPEPLVFAHRLATDIGIRINRLQ